MTFGKPGVHSEGGDRLQRLPRAAAARRGCDCVRELRTDRLRGVRGLPRRWDGSLDGSAGHGRSGHRRVGRARGDWAWSRAGRSRRRGDGGGFATPSRRRCAVTASRRAGGICGSHSCGCELRAGIDAADERPDGVARPGAPRPRSTRRAAAAISFPRYIRAARRTPRPAWSSRPRQTRRHLDVLRRKLAHASVEGEGSTFTLRLPLAPATRTPEGDPTP